MAMMINIGGSVDVISRETIKPSSPTPHTHKTFKLSFLDQLLPTFYVPVIFFYPKPDDADDDLVIACNIQNMKTSLSEALSVYYPLAGQLDPESPTVIDCNDAGAQFVHARAHDLMHDVIQDPEIYQLLKYLPLDPCTINIGSSVEAPLLAVQLTLFDCGGIALAVCSSHQLTDAVSLVSFITLWAQTCRQRGQNGKLTPPPRPVFDLARHFPPRDDLSGPGRISHIPTTGEKMATKRFVFDAEKLAALRRAVTSADGSVVKDPTRVELITAFIWSCVIEGSSSGKKKNKVSAAWHVVNLRPRIKSRPMLDNVFGNCILMRFVLSEGGKGESHELVSGLRKGLQEVDEDFIWRAAGGSKDDDHLKEFSRMMSLVVSGEMESCGFSSWSRLPVYEVDFGFTGKPVWVCPATIPDKNFVFLMGTKDGAGVELWVTMFESTLQLLDIKFQLLAVAKSQV